MKHCLVIGDPVEHSKSPELHNKWYKEKGLDKQFSFSARRVTASELKPFIDTVRGSNIRGISVTIPHKETVISLLDQIDENAKKIGAVNTIVNEGGKLIGYNTDVAGILEPLKKRTPLTNTAVCILGTGGAARAAIWATASYGANVTVWGRDLFKAQKLASEFSCQVTSNIANVNQNQIIINATSVGMTPNVRECLIESSNLHQEQIVFDLIYTPEETELIKRAKASGATVISGNEMFIAQAVEQFYLYTNSAINFR